MKFFGLLSIILFSFTALAHQPTTLEEAHEINCKGLTYEGDEYIVNVYYTLDPAWTQQAAPYTIESGKRAFVSITVNRDGATLYEDALYTNDLMLNQTEDSKQLQVKQIEVQKASQNGAIVFNDNTTHFLNISMVAEQPSAFDFELKNAHGDFNNAQCAVVQ